MADDVGIPIDYDEIAKSGHIPVPMRDATGVLGKAIPIPAAQSDAPPMPRIPVSSTSSPIIPASAPQKPILENQQGKVIPIGRHPGIQGTIDPDTQMYNTPPPNQPALAGLWAKTENIHNPFLRVLGKIGTGIARGAETLGTVVAPGVMANIPGTSLNEGIKVGAQRAAQKEETDEALKKAETENFQSEARARENPPTKIVFDQGVPVAVEAGNKQFAIGDPTMPPQFKAMADAAVAAHQQRLKEAADAKPDTATEEHQRAENIRAAQASGKPVSPDDLAWLAGHEAEANIGKGDEKGEYGAYLQYLKDNDIADTAQNRLAFHQKWEVKPQTPEQSSARGDKSYQLQSTRLDKMRQPVDQIIARVGRLNDTLNQKNPQADALVGPELLSIMSGGAGSGLRMNEAEIARVVGGRSHWEDLKASLQRWSTNPEEARSITPDQDKQIRALVAEVQKKLVKKQAILDQAEESLIGSDDPKAHRETVAGARKALDAIDAEQGGEQKPWEKYKR